MIHFGFGLLIQFIFYILCFSKKFKNSFFLKFIMKTAILTDSTVDIDETFANEKGIFFLKFHVLLNDKEYILNENMTREKYIKILKESKSFPKTATPSLDEIKSVIISLKKRGYDRFVFVVTGKKGSKMYSLCQILLNSDKVLQSQSLLFDSGFISAGMGIQVILLSQEDLDSMSFDQIYAFLDKLKKNIKLFFVSFDLSYLIKGGRLKPLPGFIGKTLNVYPIVFLTEGPVFSMKKAVGIKASIDKIQSEIDSFVEASDFDYGILSGSLESEKYAEWLNKEIKTKFDDHARLVSKFKTNLGSLSHSGSETFGIVVCRKE